MLISLMKTVAVTVVLLLLSTGAALSQDNKDMSPQARYSQALELFNQKQYEQAETLLRRLSEDTVTPDLIDNVWFWLGEAHFAQEQYPEAMQSFERVLSCAGSNKYADALLKIGLCHQRLGRHNLACTCWNSDMERCTDSNALDKRQRILNHYCH